MSPVKSCTVTKVCCPYIYDTVSSPIILGRWFLTLSLSLSLAERQEYGREIKSFFDAEPENKSSRSMSNKITCPSDYKCTKLRGEAESVCCPIEISNQSAQPEGHQQTSM